MENMPEAHRMKRKQEAPSFGEVRTPALSGPKRPELVNTLWRSQLLLSSKLCASLLKNKIPGQEQTWLVP